MSRLAWISMITMCVATSAHAQSTGARFAAGYAFAKYLEDADGSAPVGLYFAGQGLEEVSIKAEAAYHRDSEEFGSYTYTLNTFTGMVGPVVNYAAGTAQGFVHLLFGAREDRFEGDGNLSLGGEIGAGFDIPVSPKAFMRPGVDFQVFTDDGYTLKILRLSMGIAW